MSARLAAAAAVVGLALTGCKPAPPAYTYTYAPDYASCSPVSGTSKVCAFVRITYRSTKGGAAMYTLDECLEATMPAVAGLPRADAETVLRRDVASTCEGIDFMSVAVLEDPRLVDRKVYPR